MPDFLLEIGTEEIPARMIAAAQEDLRQRVEDLVSRERLAGGNFESFSTPRRLTVIATGVAGAEPAKVDPITGPSISIAYKDGKQNPAALAFAKKAGVDVSQLRKIT